MSTMLQGTVDEVKARLAGAPLSARHIEELHEEERARPRPRRGVLDTLEEMRGERAMAEPELGTARGPRPEVTPPPVVGYMKKRWGKRAIYVCKSCGRDSMDVTAMSEHVRRQHGVGA